MCFHTPFAKQVEKSFSELVFECCKNEQFAVNDQRITQFLKKHSDLEDR